MTSEELEQIDKYIQSGEYPKAIPILQTIIKRELYNEDAWMLLAQCINNVGGKIFCLRMVIKINPNNIKAGELINRIQENNEQKERSLSPLQGPAINPSTEQKSAESIKDTGKRAENDRQSQHENRESNQESIKKKLPLTPDEFSLSKAPPKQSNDIPIDPKIVIDQDEEIENEIPAITKDLSWKQKTYRLFLEDDIYHEIIDGIRSVQSVNSVVVGKTIIIDGIRILPFECPECLEIDGEINEDVCDRCDFFSPRNCLLKQDEQLIEDIIRFKIIRMERQLAYYRRESMISKIIYKELLAHGRSLHYSVIVKIANGKYPSLKLTEKRAYKLLYNHPELFERLEEGVYRSK